MIALILLIIIWAELLPNSPSLTSAMTLTLIWIFVRTRKREG